MLLETTAHDLGMDLAELNRDLLIVSRGTGSSLRKNHTDNSRLRLAKFRNMVINYLKSNKGDSVEKKRIYEIDVMLLSNTLGVPRYSIDDIYK